MIRKIAILVAVMAAVALTSSAVLAASPHIVGSTTTSGLTVSGKIAGLGNGYAGTALTATADATFNIQCSNPQGKLAPGQQGVTSSLTGSGALDSVEANGTYNFHVTFTIVTSPAKAFGCPNNQWTATAVDVVLTLTSLTLADGTVIDL